MFSRLYDPIGFLVLFTLKVKILMREICTSKNDNSNSYWDDPVSDEIYYKCRDFVEELPKVGKISFQRNLKSPEAIGNPVLIIYCDGSQYGYGACAYVR